MNISDRILIVAPHADDEVLGVGGTAAKYVSLGCEIHLVICGTRKNDSREQIDNATELYTSTTILPYQDESYYTVFNPILHSVERVYGDILPSVVFIPNHADFNQDHKCIHEVCEIVTRRYQTHPPESVLMYEIPSSTTQSFNNNFKCTYYEKLELSDVNMKINMMREYKNEMREFPNPRSALGLMTYANFRGMECGSNYAEGFQLMYHCS